MRKMDVIKRKVRATTVKAESHCRDGGGMF